MYFYHSVWSVDSPKLPGLGIYEPRYLPPIGSRLPAPLRQSGRSIGALETILTSSALTGSLTLIDYVHSLADGDFSPILTLAEPIKTFCHRFDIAPAYFV